MNSSSYTSVCSFLLFVDGEISKFRERVLCVRDGKVSFCQFCVISCCSSARFCQIHVRFSLRALWMSLLNAEAHKSLQNICARSASNRRQYEFFPLKFVMHSLFPGEKQPALTSLLSI
jgi:hypothetical protein